MCGSGMILLSTAQKITKSLEFTGKLKTNNLNFLRNVCEYNSISYAIYEFHHNADFLVALTIWSVHNFAHVMTAELSSRVQNHVRQVTPDSKVHGANMGPTWVLSAPDGPMLAPWTLLSGITRTSDEPSSLKYVRIHQKTAIFSFCYYLYIFRFVFP